MVNLEHIHPGILEIQHLLENHIENEYHDAIVNFVSTLDQKSARLFAIIVTASYDHGVDIGCSLGHLVD